MQNFRPCPLYGRLRPTPQQWQLCPGSVAALGLALLITTATGAEPAGKPAMPPPTEPTDAPLQSDSTDQLSEDDTLSATAADDALIQPQDLNSPLDPYCTSYDTRRGVLSSVGWTSLRKLAAPNRYLIGRSISASSISAREYSIFELRDQQVYPLHYQQFINGIKMQFHNYDWEAGTAQVRYRSKFYRPLSTVEVALHPGVLDNASLLVQVQLALRNGSGYIKPSEYEILYKGKFRRRAISMVSEVRGSIHTTAGRLRTVELFSLDTERNRSERMWLAEDLDYQVVWLIQKRPSRHDTILKFAHEHPMTACRLPRSISRLELMVAAK